MIYGFDTSDEPAATAALLVYAIYRSRDKARFGISLDMWAQIERFAKDAAKRSRNIPQFIEALKPRLCCGSINPKWMYVGEKGEAPLTFVYNDDGSLRHILQLPQNGNREFLTALIERSDARAVLKLIYDETAYVILLVRARMEVERPVEQQLDVITEG